MSTWTDERIETLKALWAAGKSASEIANRLGGVTRNSVIGKVHRLGISRSSSASRISSSLGSINRKGPNNIVRALRGKARAPGLAEVVMTAPTDGRPWTTRRFGECAAPVSGEGAETYSCCAPVDSDSVWCADHRAQFCVPGKKPLNIRALSRVA